LHEKSVKVVTRRVLISTKGEGDVVDITGDVQDAVKDVDLLSGIATVFVSGSTAAITTLEFERGLVSDLSYALDRISPKDVEYEHHKAWNDDNGRSHIKAAIVGPSLTVPFSDGRLVVGTWQQVVLVELDTRPRDRAIVIQVMGE
jgi:secondary thiamine-phosphate synthase enzyme